MTNILYYKSLESKTKITPRILYQKSIKRYMHRSSSYARVMLTRPLPGNATNNRHAGMYRVIEWDKKLKDKADPHPGNDLNLTQHEVTHLNIENTITKKVIGLLTSSKGNKADPKAYFEKVDVTKYEGSFTGVKDPITKQPILDSTGKMIPDPNAGGQYVAIFPRPRKYGKDAQARTRIVTEHQNYIDKVEKKIANIEANAEKHTPRGPIKKIGGKDEE